jgi:hypothetical protein
MRNMRGADDLQWPYQRLLRMVTYVPEL